MDNLISNFGVWCHQFHTPPLQKKKVWIIKKKKLPNKKLQGVMAYFGGRGGHQKREKVSLFPFLFTAPLWFPLYITSGLSWPRCRVHVISAWLLQGSIFMKSFQIIICYQMFIDINLWGLYQIYIYIFYPWLTFNIL